MLRRVRVIDVGDTNFLVDEHVEKHIFEEENERVIAAGGQPAKGEPLLLGITKASLSTECFISASSFQETTKVLTEAADLRQGRLPPRPQGERHHGPPHPGRHRPRRLQAPVGRRRGRWLRRPAGRGRMAATAAHGAAPRRPRRPSRARTSSLPAGHSKAAPRTPLASPCAARTSFVRRSLGTV